jgi:signal transduction protein with GAF and PtsI domain
MPKETLSPTISAIDTPMDLLKNPARLLRLRQTGLLDSDSEAVFDRLTRLAVAALRVPTAIISLVEEDRQFFKSSAGVPAPRASRREAPLSQSFCQYVVRSGQPYIVVEARADPALRASQAVQEMGIVAYVGIPLKTSTGEVLGSFCVNDSQPHVWTADDVAILTDLAAAVMAEIELRDSARLARELLASAEREQAEKGRCSTPSPRASSGSTARGDVRSSTPRARRCWAMHQLSCSVNACIQRFTAITLTDRLTPRPNARRRAP